MPATFGGLLLFVVFVVPGYIWVRTAEVHDPRSERSGLTEAAELVFVGLISSLAASTIVLWVADLSLVPLVQGGAAYLGDRADIVIESLLWIFGLSTGGTMLAAQLWFRRGKGSGRLRPGSTPWFDALIVGSKGRDVIVCVSTVSRRVYVGSLISFTVDPEAKVPDIVLGPEIHVSDRGEPYSKWAVDRVVVPGPEIREVQVRYSCQEPEGSTR